MFKCFFLNCLMLKIYILPEIYIYIFNSLILNFVMGQINNKKFNHSLYNLITTFPSPYPKYLKHNNNPQRVSPQNKQLELGDKMDLASYLLKPIQRMSKYALLLKDLIKECSQSQEQELSDLRTAEEMVKFQLRHGNDLLAMDAIRGCDVR